MLSNNFLEIKKMKKQIRSISVLSISAIFILFGLTGCDFDLEEVLDVDVPG